jgi:hypothetical protein
MADRYEEDRKMDAVEQDVAAALDRRVAYERSDAARIEREACAQTVDIAVRAAELQGLPHAALRALAAAIRART